MPQTKTPDSQTLVSAAYLFAIMLMTSADSIHNTTPQPSYAVTWKQFLVIVTGGTVILQEIAIYVVSGNKSIPIIGTLNCSNGLDISTMGIWSTRQKRKKMPSGYFNLPVEIENKKQSAALLNLNLVAEHKVTVSRPYRTLNMVHGVITTEKRNVCRMSSEQ